MFNEKTLFTWSGGKDSALALFELQKDHRYEVIALLTTITREYKRISMHGVKQELLDQQAKSLGIQLDKVYISKDSSNEDYEERMRKRLLYNYCNGVTGVVYGDIFLEDLKIYREKNLAKIGMKAIFPLWGRDTLELSSIFIDNGFRAVITCVDSEKLDKKFAGCEYDRKCIKEFGSGIDPCGENGEFHTFVYDGPIFKNRIQFKKGRVLLRENRFYFCDLLPV